MRRHNNECQTKRTRGSGRSFGTFGGFIFRHLKQTVILCLEPTNFLTYGTHRRFHRAFLNATTLRHENRQTGHNALPLARGLQRRGYPYRLWATGVEGLGVHVASFLEDAERILVPFVWFEQAPEVKHTEVVLTVAGLVLDEPLPGLDVGERGVEQQKPSLRVEAGPPFLQHLVESGACSEIEPNHVEHHLWTTTTRA